MPTFENKKHGLNFTHISEEKMDSIISADDARIIYTIGKGFGKLEGFKDFYNPGITYREFIDKLIKIGLLEQRKEENILIKK